ncbi:MmcQ/YjbR family DNA-binding protein [Acidiphilium acidophilum]|uniref:MmcQ/YjbR family DNA-binding protein n=1 Tax=Acidiphilium acidophilum TaxID=76588 RepID=UPI002E8E7582|nr:MmcQ/YjbR family DNA-binding protein [Acidiphilium acidophilum]
MTEEDFDKFCAALPHTNLVIQWRGAHVWKVGAKMFAVGRWDNGEPAITFKVGEVAYEILKQSPGLRPAPYLASRGATWLQLFGTPSLPNDDIRQYIRTSYHIISNTRPKRPLGGRPPGLSHLG